MCPPAGTYPHRSTADDAPGLLTKEHAVPRVPTAIAEPAGGAFALAGELRRLPLRFEPFLQERLHQLFSRVVRAGVTPQGLVRDVHRLIVSLRTVPVFLSFVVFGCSTQPPSLIRLFAKLSGHYRGRPTPKPTTPQPPRKPGTGSG